MPPLDDANLIPIGRIGGPRGVSGELRVVSYSGEYGHFRSLDRVLLVRPPEAPREPAGGRTRFATPAEYALAMAKASTVKGPSRLEIRIESMEEDGQGLVIRVKGYDSREKAGDLTGMEIMVPPSRGARLRRGEWYVRDLVGIDLVHRNEKVATVLSVFEGSSDPCLEVRTLAGEVCLIPFRKEFIGTIDLVAKKAELLALWVLES